MENFPAEVLEIVFHPLSKQEDIQKCYETNSKWRHIIENMFSNKTVGFSFSSLEEVQKCFNFCTAWQRIIGNKFENNSKILVAGGWRKGMVRPLEIIDLINTKLKSDFVILNGNSASIVGTDSAGGILQNQPVFCGGFDNDTWNHKSNIDIIGKPNHGLKMLRPRRSMSSVVLNESKLWITGGNQRRSSTNSTEIISLDQPPVPGPDLSFNVFWHSMVLVDPTTIYLIGGCQNGQESSKTWIIDPTNNFQIKVGPSLNIARTEHSCSKMKIEGRIFLAVAGGVTFGSVALDSVELLDTAFPEQGWKMGPKLPFKLFGSTMISSPTEKGIVMIGGLTPKGVPANQIVSNNFVELSGNSIETLEWKILEQKLQYPRCGHVLFSISNEIASTLTTESVASSVHN